MRDRHCVGVTSDPEVLCDQRARLGESPVLDESMGRIVWVDIPAGALWSCSLYGSPTGATLLAQLDTDLSAVVPRRGGGWAAAVADGFGFISEKGGFRLAAEHTPEHWRRMNDAKADHHGRLWAGSTARDFRTGAGSLHRWDGGCTALDVRRNMTLPNGLGWSPDHQSFYLVDSRAGVAFIALVDDTGNVHDFRPLIAFRAHEVPDGLCVDAEGCLWIAMWGAGEVRRYSPTGVLLGSVTLPVSRPTSCAMSTDGNLYVTSAMPGAGAPDEVHAGKVFAVGTSTCGMPAMSLAG